MRSLRTFVYMLKPGIILPPHSDESLIRKLPKRDQLTWYVYKYPTGTDTSYPDNIILTDINILPLLSEVLFVLDPEFCRFDYLTSAIRNSCHLFVDNITNLTEGQQHELINLAREAGTWLVVRSDSLFTPLTRELLNSKIKADFVKVEHMASNPEAHWLQTISNYLRIVLKLSHTTLSAMEVKGGNFLSETTDVIDIRLRFENALVVSLHFSRMSIRETSQLILYQKGEILDANFNAHTLTLFPGEKSQAFRHIPSDELLLHQIGYLLHADETTNCKLHTLEEETELLQLTNRIKNQLRLNSISI